MRNPAAHIRLGLALALAGLHGAGYGGQEAPKVKKIRESKKNMRNRAAHIRLGLVLALADGQF